MIKKLHFYVDIYNREIYKVIEELFNNNFNVDIVTILNYIKSNNSLNKCGGVSYITDIITNGILYNHFNDYLRIIKEKSLRRKIIKIGTDMIINSYEKKEVEVFLEETQKKIYEAAISEVKEDNLVEINEGVRVTLEDMEKCYKNGGKFLGFPTGFDSLDNVISGLQKGNLVIIAGRPSMGKTTFAQNIAQYCSKFANTIFFSLEMDMIMILKKFFAAGAMVEYKKVAESTLNDDEFLKIVVYSNKLSKKHLYIDDKTKNLEDIKKICRRLKYEKGLDIIFIDYLQLINVKTPTYSREQEIGKISRELKNLAKDLEITVVAMSQLSRASEQRGDHRPILSDLRESGNIEQDADIIMMLYREYYYEESANKNLTELIINKNRSGETKKINLWWNSEFQRFGDVILNS